MKPRIVCAAIRATSGDIVCSARHYDMRMHNIISLMSDPDNFYTDCEQGFIDQFGKFYTREQAYIIALNNSQIIREIGYATDKLFSEHLY